MRQDGTAEGALPAKHQDARKNKKKKIIRRIKHQVVSALQTIKIEVRVETQRETIPLVNTVAKKVTHHLNTGGDQMQSAASIINLDMKL